MCESAVSRFVVVVVICLVEKLCVVIVYLEREGRRKRLETV